MFSKVRLFAKAQEGYVLVLSLIMVPVFLGFGLLVIDVSRGNNAHGDLSAAADAVALAGARELDGNTGAIDRAKVAMAQVTNSVSMLGLRGDDMEIELEYADVAGNEFTVIFLSDMPDNDTTPLTSAFLSANATTDDAEAEFVYVAAQSRNLATAFINPANLLPGSVPIGAIAVAKAVSATCNLTPLYICNPFEEVAGYSGDDLQDSFDDGKLHGRMVRLHPKGNGTHEPGNFGFLQVESANGNISASADEIRDIFAGRRNVTCYQAGRVTTKPGAAQSIAQGINTAMDIWTGNYGSYNGGLYPSNPNDPLRWEIKTSSNVRKGYKPATGNACNSTASDDHLGNSDGELDGVYGFPDNTVMNAFTGVDDNGNAIPGAIVGEGAWDLDAYWNANYGTNAPQDLINSSSFPNALAPGDSGPSRYDVYKYEIANNLTSNPSVALDDDGNPGGEVGDPTCKTVSTDDDRRLIYAAIIDCNSTAAEAEGGGVNTYAVNSYAELFLTRPMGKNGNGANAATTTYTDPITGDEYEASDATIDVEIVRVTGAGSNGVLENFIRNEAILIR